MPRLKGFTLIEMVITVVIVGILASMAVPVASVTLQRAREAELRAALRQIRGALDAYKKAADAKKILVSVDKSGYPPSLEVLVDGVPDATRPDGAKLRFLRRIPRDPMAKDAAASAAGTWGKRSYASSASNPTAGEDVFDVHSLSPEAGMNGVPYREW